jgi:23S rRNA pseudouridine1911/1915/1917 synthase
MIPPGPISLTADRAGITLAALLRERLPDRSWSRVRRLIETRGVQVNGEPCLDPARRLKEGEAIQVSDRPMPARKPEQTVVVRYLDEHIVVVEKPSGMNTVRHPSEREWSHRRKALSATLEDIVPKLIARDKGRPRKGPLPRLRVVHRLDKETSGLVVFARTVAAERELGKQFRRHCVVRRYLAVVPGSLESQTIRSRLVRDRGDGRRGSTRNRDLGKEAVTHVEVVEPLSCYTLVSCRLETGRTHQIRIHLAELGRPICGEKVYNRRPGEQATLDKSGAPRPALHATELGFVHPTTKEVMHWSMPLPPELAEFVEKLRRHERGDQVEGCAPGQR